MAENHSKKSTAEGNPSLKPKRSLTSRDRNFANRNALGRLHRNKWEAGEDQSDDYSQIEPFGPEGAGDGSYMADGYGYDDDEYDHLNDKRFDGDVDKLNDDSGKDQNSYDNNVIMTDKIEAPAPEATTIELLNFETKNLNPGSEDNSGNDSPTIKSLGSHKNFNSKESLVGAGMKKENDEHKSEDSKDICPGNDKNTGQIKVADNKAGESKQSVENKPKVAKASDTRKEQKLKENEKENSAVASNPKFNEVSKNEEKIVSKEVKGADSKVQTNGREENDAASKLKDTKSLDDNISEPKANSEGEKHSQESSVSELFGSDYKDGFDNMNESGLTDEEKSAEEKNIVGLRDTINELPYMYMKGPLKGVRKKGVPRRNLGYWSDLFDTVKEERSADRGAKEPYHLDFPLADLENTDYHRNFVKSLKRFKNLDESDRILSQGDTPSPFVDQNKKQIAPQVIEEEQRKRRSRLRRLKAGPFFVVKERGRGDRGALYAYGPSIRARLPYGGSFSEAPRYNGRRATGMYRRNINNFGASPKGEDLIPDDEELVNVKSIGEDEVRLSESGSEDEDDSFAEGLFQTERLIGYPAKRKSSSQKDIEMKLQKEKFKEQSANVDSSSSTNNPLVLVQRKDNGARGMKTFVESKSRNEEGVNLEDLAKLLSRDSNYVVLRKVPGKSKAQKISNSGYERQNELKLSAGSVSNSDKKDNFKSLHSGLSPKEHRTPMFQSSERKSRMESLAEGEMKKDETENLIKLLRDDDLDQNKMSSVDSGADRASLFRRGEPNKKLVYKPPLSQAYRHMKDFESPAQIIHREVFRRSEKPEKSSQVGEERGNLGSERMLKSFKKEGKELVFLNRPYKAIAVKTKSQEAMVQDLGVNTATDNPLPPLSMYDSVMVPLVPPIQSPSAQYVSAQNQSPSKMAQQNYASQSTIPQFTNSQQSVNSAGINSNGLVTGTNAAGNKVPNTNYGKSSGFVPTDGMIFNANLMPGISYFNPVPSSIPAQNGMIVNSNTPMQIKLPEITQKSSDYNRNYYLYGTQNAGRTNSPVHEIKVVQQGMNMPQGDSYKPPNFLYAGNVQNFDPKLQNYNKHSMLLKNPESGKATPGDKSNTNILPLQRPPADTLMKHGSYSLTQHWLANVFQTNKKPMTVYDNYKTVLKKDNSDRQRQLSGNLRRFMRDFQGLGQPFIQSTYSGQQLPGMSLQELTRHSDKHLQKLNNFLREIISNREETVTEGKKNVKRGMLKKDKVDKAWHEKNAEVNSRVSAGKWTSVTGDGSSPMDNTGKNSFPEDALAHNSEKTKEAKLNNQYLKRSKRSLSYDSAMKESTEAMEVKVKSIPYKVEPQRLDFTNVNSNGREQQQQQPQSNSRSYMAIPPDKLMDLLNILPSLQGEHAQELPLLNDMCKRQVSLDESESNGAFRRKLLSVGDGEEASDVDKKQADCIRKSFESFLDPLVQKIADYENKRIEKARKRREIELDESTPNDFQNFLMTSLGGPGSQKREVVKKEEAIWESEAQHDISNQIVDGAGNRDPNEGSAIGKREASSSGREPKSQKDSIFADDSTKIRIRIVDGNTDGELAKSSETGYKSQLTRKDMSLRDENNPRVHEVYLIAKADTKKKKSATTRSGKSDNIEAFDRKSFQDLFNKFFYGHSDQTVQKQPISSHLPQVETVYNPSPGSNKAQIENINEQKCFAKPQIYYNGSASSMEDNIIRTNLRTGNSNTFTYQSKEEHSPYPLQSPIHSLEYESPDSINFDSPRSLPLQKSFASLTNNNQDIIYKDESPPMSNLMMSNSKHNDQQLDQQTFRSYDPTLPLRRESTKMYGNAPNNLNPDVYAKEGPMFGDHGRSNKKSFRADYDSHGNTEENGQAFKEEDIEGLEETINPKMVEMWKKYAKTYLTPSSHKEAMDREFKEAYLRTSASQITSKSDKDKFGASLIRDINQQDDDHLTKDRAEPSGFDKTKEKVGKRRTETNQNHNRPVQIGQRVFYSFKTEIPAQYYYTPYVGPMGIKNENGAVSGTKKTEDVQINPQGLKVKRESGEAEKLDKDVNVIGGYIVRKSVSDRGENGGEKRTKRKSELYEARNDFPESRNRVKRSAGSTKSVDEPKIMEKRLSSGHLTESHFRKYHRKNISEKRNTEEDKRGRVNVKHLCPDKRVRRDTLSETLKADLSRRIEQEKKARMMVKNLKVELTKDENPFWSGNLIPLVTVPDENPKPDSADDAKKELTERQKNERQEQAYQSHTKNDTPDVYKTFEIKRERRKSWESAKVKRAPRERGGHAIIARSQLDQRKELKTFSDEGFEPLTPDARFSERSNARNQGSKARVKEEPYKVPLSEPGKSDRKIDKSRAAENGAQKQFTHGFSHEAPLLTPLNPLESPMIFDALKRAPEADPKFGQQSDSTENAAKTRENVNSQPKYDAKSATIESKNDPLVGAVLVLAKRESNRLDEAANNGSGHFALKKRKSDWSEMAEEPKQSLEIGELPHEQAVEED